MRIKYGRFHDDGIQMNGVPEILGNIKLIFLLSSI